MNLKSNFDFVGDSGHIWLEVSEADRKLIFQWPNRVFLPKNLELEACIIVKPFLHNVMNSLIYNM